MKLLVVEDEHRIAESIKKGFEQEHATVDIAFSGTDGYDLASSGDYECIILDLMLPEKTGLELCKDLRNAHIQTPILILTAKGQTQDKVKGLDTGADDYMTKPFSFEELLARVRALVRRPKILVDSTLTVSDLTLDTSTFTVTRHHKKIQLTGKEYNLLEYLMRHTPQTLSKDQIIAHVWDYHADILPNTVEVTIRNLRKKIDNSFPSKKTLIRTVRGFGYAIGA